MTNNTRIHEAYQRLLQHLGSEDERSAADRGKPLERPTEAVLMSRACQESLQDPQIGTTYLRAALELAALDQYHAETRERNLVAELRRREVSWADIAFHRGLRSAQAAQQRYERLRRVEEPQIVVYAYRDADTVDAHWFGEPDALPPGQYEIGWIDFNPRERRPFSGKRLELRIGAVEAELMPPYLRAHPIVNGRAYPVTKAVQIELFGA